MTVLNVTSYSKQVGKATIKNSGLPTKTTVSSCADSKHELYSHQLSSLFSRVLASLHAPRVNSYSRTFYITCDYITKKSRLSKSKVLTHSPVFVQLANKHQEFLVHVRRKASPSTAARRRSRVEVSVILSSGDSELPSVFSIISSLVVFSVSSVVSSS